MVYAAAYIRVSTDDQTEYSPDAQLRAIKSYCKKNDYFLDPQYIFVDEGKSGRKAKSRPAFMKMIGTAKQKPSPFQFILCHKFDRFARNREDSVVYKSLLSKECGVKVISITESIDNDKMSLIMESMLEAMAEYYSINLAEEVKKGMTEKARRGEPCSIAPFGYKMVDKKLIPIKAEADRISKIFTDFIAGKAYCTIAKECNVDGFKTHRGSLFENRTVDYIIHNPTYAGYIRWTPTGKIRRNFSNPESLIVKGQHEPIITTEIFEAADKRSKEIKALYKPYSKPIYKPSHWLVGLLRCAYCGCSLVNNNGYFVCNGYTHGKCKHRNSIRINDMEKLVISKIKYDISDPDSLNVIHVEDNEKNQLLASRLADLNIRLLRCKDAYERGIDSIDEYAANKSRLTAEVLKMKEEKEPQREGYQKQLTKNMFALLHCENDKSKVAHEFINQILWNKDAEMLTISYFV